MNHPKTKGIVTFYSQDNTNGDRSYQYMYSSDGSLVFYCVEYSKCKGSCSGLSGYMDDDCGLYGSLLHLVL